MLNNMHACVYIFHIISCIPPCEHAKRTVCILARGRSDGRLRVDVSNVCPQHKSVCPRLRAYVYVVIHADYSASAEQGYPSGRTVNVCVCVCLRMRAELGNLCQPAKFHSATSPRDKQTVVCCVCVVCVSSLPFSLAS